MSKLRGEALYTAALERLKNREAEIVDTSDPDFHFSTTTVAVEAGKQKGFIRASRYPELCKKIGDAEEVRKLKQPDPPKKKKNTSETRVTKLSAQYNALKEEYELCLEKMLNLIRSNYELKSEIESLKSNVSHVDFSKN
jgi:archaellum component FlaC